MEVGQAVLALDLVNPQLDLAEGLLLILVEVGERNLNDAALEGVVRVFYDMIRLADYECESEVHALRP